MGQVVVIEAPTVAPLTLAQAKAQCNATGFTTDDDLIQRLLDTATAWVDGPQSWLGRSLTPQTLELRQETFSAWGRNGYGSSIWDAYEGGSKHALEDWSPVIKLPFGPVQSINTITYVDQTGETQTVDPSVYALNNDRVAPAYGQSWPTPRGDIAGVRIQYVAGYPLGEGETPTTPSPICHAILMCTSHWYRNRDAVVGVEGRDSSTEIPLGIESLLGSYEVYD